MHLNNLQPLISAICSPCTCLQVPVPSLPETAIGPCWCQDTYGILVPNCLTPDSEFLYVSECPPPPPSPPFWTKRGDLNRVIPMRQTYVYSYEYEYRIARACTAITASPGLSVTQYSY